MSERNDFEEKVEVLKEEAQEKIGNSIENVEKTVEDLKTKMKELTADDPETAEKEDRKLKFQVKVYDEKGLIGEGIHERFLIKNDKFMEKAEAKLK